jgi:peptidoglycan/LPS O-acetylase OafA/YrhL
MAEPRAFFPGIHALRTVAATLVVIEHAYFVANGYVPMSARFSCGTDGVILFFAISGFVISLQRKKPVAEFVIHRLLRIYPSYWLAMILAAAALALVRLPVSSSASSILLYPSAVSDSSLAIPYWTLIFEMLFYALAAVSFWLRLSDGWLTIIAVLWVVIVNVVAAEPTVAAYTFPGFPSILWSPAVQAFPMGLICGIHFDRLKRAGRWPYTIVAMIAFAASLAFAPYSSHALLSLGISASCLILALADLDIRSRVVAVSGDASYGIYLMHFPTIIVAARISPAHGLLWFLAIGMSAGMVFGLFDRRMHKTLATSAWRRSKLIS